MRTRTFKLLELYVRWLFGAVFLGLATYDENGKARINFLTSHVKMLDMAVRTTVAECMNSNVDVAEAFKRATGTKS